MVISVVAMGFYFAIFIEVGTKNVTCHSFVHPLSLPQQYDYCDTLHNTSNASVFSIHFYRNMHDIFFYETTDIPPITNLFCA